MNFISKHLIQHKYLLRILLVNAKYTKFFFLLKRLNTPYIEMNYFFYMTT
jgi:hypothetical protein